jgi:hypothetical protein
MLITGIIICLALSGRQAISWPPIHDADREALEQLYDATGGAMWKDRILCDDPTDHREMIAADGALTDWVH